MLSIAARAGTLKLAGDAPAPSGRMLLDKLRGGPVESYLMTSDNHQSVPAVSTGNGMPTRDSVDGNPDDASTVEFVAQLRQKAKDAVAASMQYADLSQHYMDLSQKLATLAEQAGSVQLDVLQQTLENIERGAKSSASRHDSYPLQEPAGSDTQNDAPAGERVDAPFAALTSKSDSEQSARTSSGAGQSDDAAVVQNSAPVQASKAPGQSRRRRKVLTRKLVERARSAGLAVRGRIRVKAKKADLAPRVRTATDEITNNKGSIAASVCFLISALFLLSLITLQFEPEHQLDPIVAGFAEEPREVEEALPVDPPEEEAGEQTEQEVEDPQPEMDEPEPEPEEPEPEPEEAEPMESAEMDVETDEVETPVPEVAAGEPVAAVDAASADNRSEAGRKAMLQKYGGSQASESAVSNALDWLVSIQHPTGYWDFVSVGAAGNAGTVNNPIGGTAYALLPFLAAGQTHKAGQYQKQVGKGLDYLTRIGVKAPAGYDLRGMVNKNSDDDSPNEAYYVQGAATLALCEAYGMTRDRRLRKPAEDAIRFIVNSQDPRGGGWRYNPQEPGSTSVTVVQLMALMSAKKAGLKVPAATLKGITKYLDSVQVDQEGRYGYEIQKKRYTGAVTSMALLSRMYLGWGRDDGDMRAGVALLDKAGPYDNLYSLYFATQVMRNWGGQEWERWNVRMRDDLVAMQVKDGPGAGSWKPRTGAIHAKQGGRLLTTALATLTLEVYYRYQPLLPEQE